MSEQGRKGYGRLAALGLALAGAAWLVRKVFSLKSMAGNISLVPSFAGAPSYRDSQLVIPISVGVNNTSGGSVSVEVSRMEVYMDESLVAYATMPEQNKLTIAANAYSVLSGFKVALPINVILQKLSDNAFDIVSGNYDKILGRLSAKLDAVVGGVVSVSATHRFGAGATAGLGVVASGKRKIGDLSDYRPYIPPKSELRREDKYVATFANHEDTVRLMQKVVATTLDDTRRLAKWLERGTVRETVLSIWKFVYGYIQYETDSVFAEQVRRPLRTLYDQRGDCDCFSTLIGSILTNLGIPYKFRVAAISGRSYYQHVYVIVPVGTDGNYYVCDPVMDVPFKECNVTKCLDY